jgi:hypothetical protein
MHDPLSDSLNAGAYGQSQATEVLMQLFQAAHPGPVAAAVEVFLKRLAMIEMILEDKELEIGEKELEAFLVSNHREVDEETYKLAQLLFGRVATREGG